MVNERGTYSDGLGKLEDGKFVTVTNVDGSGLGAVHQEDETVNQVVDVLERSSLGSITVDGHVLALERLDDKVRDDSAVVGVHPGAERVEDSGNSDIDAVLPHVAVRQGLGDSLALVVARSGTNTVDVTPVVLSLGVLLGVTVNLGRRRNEESGLGSLGETEHVERTHERRLDGLDGVVLVVRGRGRAGEVVDLCIVRQCTVPFLP